MKVQKDKLSRRDFFRLAGVGVGAAALTTAAKPLAPNQEVGQFADPAGRPNRPWWVKTVDVSTNEIDWDNTERYDEQMGTVRGPGLAIYVGQDEVERQMAAGSEIRLKRLKEDADGYSHKDLALANSMNMGGASFLGPQTAPTPESLGVSKWTGTPEEAARMLRVAMRTFGAATVGFVELDERTRKLIYSVDPDGKKMIFTDDPVASETEDARYIPNSCKYAIVYTIRMSQEQMRRAPTKVSRQTTMMGYQRGIAAQTNLQQFLRGLGYQCLGEATPNALGIAPALAIQAGLGELGRMNRLITPEFGPVVRVFKMLTDLPVAVDKPIDAGIFEFCKSCKKCAEACPVEAISFEDEPTWQVRGGWNSPGHKAFFDDATKCMGYLNEADADCSVCFSVCPFSKQSKAWVHDWVKAGISTAPMLDGFFRSMDDAFGYGAPPTGESYWSLNLPEYGFDSSETVKET